MHHSLSIYLTFYDHISHVGGRPTNMGEWMHEISSSSSLAHTVSVSVVDRPLRPPATHLTTNLGVQPCSLARSVSQSVCLSRSFLSVRCYRSSKAEQSKVRRRHSHSLMNAQPRRQAALLERPWIIETPSPRRASVVSQE
eukprot:GHVU01033791.1.p1 GENE.GHVU01033791.1~~GHVU01033791.1.p1  ORF type:complete len:140 (+),score=0.63 GHVU01033791.1:472-891(+)